MLVDTAMNLVMGGRGQWVRKASRFRALNGRYGGAIGLSLHSYSRQAVSAGVRASRVRRAYAAQVTFNWLTWHMGI